MPMSIEPLRSLIETSENKDDIHFFESTESSMDSYVDDSAFNRSQTLLDKFQSRPQASNLYWSADVIEQGLMPTQVASLGFVSAQTSKTVPKKAVFRINPSELNSVSLETFRRIIIEKPYSSQATFMGVPLISQSEWLGWDGDNHILFQVTGGNALVSPRMCMVALSESPTQSNTKVRINWKLIDNYDATSHDFTGSWGRELDNQGITYPNNAIWTPYNSGYWELDLAAGTITYSLVSDPGGSLLFNPNEAFMAYPNYVVNEILGLSGSFVQTI